MEKKLSERIAERAIKKKPSRNAKNRAQFLAVRSDIKEALDDGWSVKDIWETLHSEGAITFSYEAFRNHVNAWRNAPKPTNKENRPTPPINDANKQSETKPEKSHELPSFKHNPTPKREDLI